MSTSRVVTTQNPPKAQLAPILSYPYIPQTFSLFSILIRNNILILRRTHDSTLSVCRVRFFMNLEVVCFAPLLRTCRPCDVIHTCVHEVRLCWSRTSVVELLLDPDYFEVTSPCWHLARLRQRTCFDEDDTRDVLSILLLLINLSAASVVTFSDIKNISRI